MKITRALPLAALAILCFGASIFARADALVFSLTQTYTPTSFAAGTGVGQAVFVDTTTTIDSFGFYLEQRGGGDVNYFILDETTGQTLLAPDAVAVPNSPKAWTYLDGLDLTLEAGDTYIFGVYGNGLMTIGMDPLASSSTTLSLPASGPSSYAFTGDTQGAALSGAVNPSGLSTTDLGVQIIDPPNAPEPSSLLLLGTGILAAAGVVRKRLTYQRAGLQP